MSNSSLFLIAMLFTSMASVGAQQGQPARPGPLPSVEDRAAGLRKIDGFIPLYWDERAGTMLLEVSRFDSEFLMSTGLSAGLGSNDLGLDRGQGGQGRLVRFQRVGPRVLLVQPNQSFRSSSPNVLERKAVEDSFAKSVLWGFTVAAESNGRVLVDATDFFLRDVHGAAGGLRPGTYRVDRSRSTFYLEHTKAFPKNTEVDVLLTFVNEAVANRGGLGPAQGPAPIGATGGGGGGGGGFGGNLFSGTVASVTPTPDAVTLREHLSFVELPPEGFTPRIDDPRAGYGGLSFVDYSQPIGEPIVFRYMRRHRLVKKDPAAAMSEPVTPIQYWVDSGAPEDVKKALIEGAMWWNQAFEAAGFRNAFKVDVLPPDADPMDVRYNMINWVHRSTRGWSSGGSMADPRTGEIIKATVTLGSLRDRQDYMIFEGLLSPYETGREKPSILYETALARIRQLSAHEVGHTLGLGHNYYDSTKGWISVMDYPHPLEELKADGTIDISKAYEARIGDWDKVAINFGYRQFPAGIDQAAALTRIVDDAWTQDLRYFTNQDSDIHPRTEQWSNGVNQAEELNRLMKVRRAALNRMGEKTIRLGAPMTTIEEPFVPIFMYHRYAVESTVVDAGRPGLRLRDARRRTDAGEVGDGGQPAPGARGAGGHAQAVGAHRAQGDPRRDRAPAAGLRLPSRAVPAHHRRGLRSAEPRHHRRRRDHRLRIAARPRRPAGGAERRRSDAARARRGDRSIHQGHLRRRDGVAVRSRGAAGRRARARRSRDLAGDVGAQRPGAGHCVAQARAAGRAPAHRRRSQGGGRPGAAGAAGRRHQALPRAAERRPVEDRAGGAGAAGCADRRQRPGLVAGAAALQLGRRRSRRVAVLPAAAIASGDGRGRLDRERRPPPQRRRGNRSG